MSQHTLQHHRDRWLQLHDLRTGGIMGLCPLTMNLPVRLTLTLGKERHAVTISRCILTAWELHPIDGARVAACTEPGTILGKLLKHYL